MVKDTLQKIEDIVKGAKRLPDHKQATLLSLISKLKDDLSQLNLEEDAQSIAGFAKAATHESLREGVDPELQLLSQQGLKASIRKFEITHPELAKTINAICNTLSNLGI